MCQQGFNYSEGSWLHIFAFSPKHAFLWSTRLYLYGVYHSLNAVTSYHGFLLCIYSLGGSVFKKYLQVTCGNVVSLINPY